MSLRMVNAELLKLRKRWGRKMETADPALPSPVMNSRRRIGCPQSSETGRFPARYHSMPRPGRV